MFLRRVHDLLSCLLSTDGRSSSLPVEDRASDCAASMLISNWFFKTRIKFTEITDLSNTLFDQLEEQFELLFSDEGRPALTGSYQEVLILLLRCCIVMLQFLEFDLSLVVDKCNILLSIFRRLFVPNLTFPHCSCKVGAGLNDVARGVTDLIPLRCPNILIGTSEMNEETRRLMLSFFCRVLEVFMEEILMNCQIRKHFTMTDNVSSTTQKLFVSHGSYGDIYAIQEIISSHFLLSANDEWTFQGFINLLFGGEVEDVSELSLSTVLSLLGTRSMYFMPCMLEAHLVLWASKCIHMQRPDYDDEISRDEMMNFHLEAFELSVNIYVDYSKRLKFVDDTNGGSAQICLHSKKLHFDSCIQPMT
ncbi:hypothetical protein Cni_G29261 [Canna indica]|uniref:DUF7812 domain-containing protein n=1 Tax=Canna indica TaxID=4628 RepID=A0AAQ3L8T6_9LILI|nr:hypothetical protein Cni_G29261 [Canna indica]